MPHWPHALPPPPLWRPFSRPFPKQNTDFIVSFFDGPPQWHPKWPRRKKKTFFLSAFFVDRRRSLFLPSKDEPADARPFHLLPIYATCVLDLQASLGDSEDAAAFSPSLHIMLCGQRLLSLVPLPMANRGYVLETLDVPPERVWRMIPFEQNDGLFVDQPDELPFLDLAHMDDDDEQPALCLPAKLVPARHTKHICMLAAKDTRDPPTLLCPPARSFDVQWRPNLVSPPSLDHVHLTLFHVQLTQCRLEPWVPTGLGLGASLYLDMPPVPALDTCPCVPVAHHTIVPSLPMPNSHLDLFFNTMDILMSVPTAAASFQTTLSPQDVMRLERIYSGFAVALHVANSVIESHDQRTSSLLPIDDIDALLAAGDPTPAKQVQALPVRRSFTLAQTATHQLHSFMAMNALQTAAVDPRVALVDDHDVFFSWQTPMLDACDDALRAGQNVWLVLPERDSGADTDALLILRHRLSRSDPRVVVVRQNEIAYAQQERLTTFFATTRVRNRDGSTIATPGEIDFVSLSSAHSAQLSRATLILLDLAQPSSVAAFSSSETLRGLLATARQVKTQIVVVSTALPDDIDATRRLVQRTGVRFFGNPINVGLERVWLDPTPPVTQLLADVCAHADEAFLSMLSHATSFALLDAPTLDTMRKQSADAIAALFDAFRPRMLGGTPAMADAFRQQGEPLVQRSLAVRQCLDLRHVHDALLHRGPLTAAKLISNACSQELIERVMHMADEAEAGLIPSSPKLLLLFKLLNALHRDANGAKVVVCISDDQERADLAMLLRSELGAQMCARNATDEEKLDLFRRSTILVCAHDDMFVRVLWPQLYAVVLFDAPAVRHLLVLTMPRPRVYALAMIQSIPKNEDVGARVLANVRSGSMALLVDTKPLFEQTHERLTSQHVPISSPQTDVAQPPDVHSVSPPVVYIDQSPPKKARPVNLPIPPPKKPKTIAPTFAQTPRTANAVPKTLFSTPMTPLPRQEPENPNFEQYAFQPTSRPALRTISRNVQPHRLTRRPKSMVLNGVGGDDARTLLEKARQQHPTSHGFATRKEELSFSKKRGQPQTKLQWH